MPGEPVPHRQPLLLPAGALPARKVVVQVVRSVCTPAARAGVEKGSRLVPALVPPGVTPPRHMALLFAGLATSASPNAMVFDVPSVKSATLYAVLWAKVPVLYWF